MNTGQTVASVIDHTLLKPNVTKEQIIRLCEEAKQYGFASVCVNPCYVRLAADQLKGASPKVCTAIGFPLGATTTAAKLAEAEEAVRNGADELDYVINISDALNGCYDAIRAEMEAFVQFKRKTASAPVIKCILETCYLEDEQIVRICQLAKETGVDYVKTSTGFGTGGATVHHVRLMRETVGPDVGVKASGGIRTYQDCQAMLQAGASRIGASASVAIVTQSADQGDASY